MCGVGPVLASVIAHTSNATYQLTAWVHESQTYAIRCSATNTVSIAVWLNQAVIVSTVIYALLLAKHFCASHSSLSSLYITLSTPAILFRRQ